jgi:hypothetical protein
MISSMTLTEKKEFKKIFFIPKGEKAPKCIVDHLVGGMRVGLWLKQKLIFPHFRKNCFCENLHPKMTKINSRKSWRKFSRKLRKAYFPFSFF